MSCNRVVVAALSRRILGGPEMCACPRRDRVQCLTPSRCRSCMSRGDPEKRAIAGASWRRGDRALCLCICDPMQQRSTSVGAVLFRVFFLQVFACVPPKLTSPRSPSSPAARHLRSALIPGVRFQQKFIGLICMG